MLLAALAAFVVNAAPPEAVVTAVDCKARKCRLSKQKSVDGGEVWKATLPKKKDDDCREPPEEYWFVPTTGTAQLLLEVCNNGYGASGVGEDSIEISSKQFKHSRYGGSAWRWTGETVIGLSPLRVQSDNSTSFHAAMPNMQKEQSWNWDTFSGSAKDTVPLCNKDGEPDQENEDGKEFKSTLLPSVELPEAFRKDGWKTTELGDCSAVASFVTFGKQSAKSDASMKVIGHFPNDKSAELYVEVRDDVFVEQASKWTLADHVELWIGETSGAWEACAGKKAGSQWALMLDGKVNAGFGNPKPNAVSFEVAKADGVVRMKIVAPLEWSQMTALVYSDSDDGKKQKALLATSQLKFADMVSFSHWKRVVAKEAVCEVDGGALKPKITRVFAPKTALIE